MTDLPSRLATALADRYRIERELGAGGMATVYLAHDLKHDRRVALKVLRPELAAVIGAERFLAEIRTTANLQHPHILPLFDSGEAEGQLFYVMPYLEGESLRDRITREKQLPVDDVVRLGVEVAGALDYAHRQGVVHRDIKPENILLQDGRALVADFGIALAVSSAGSRLTETGMSVGTPFYMSPEQAMGGHEVTARSDVYALGASLYEALVGEPPFTGSTAQAVIARIVTEDPRPLVTQRRTIPSHVEGAVLAALQRLPADRFATAADFGAALEARGSLPGRVAGGAGAGRGGRGARARGRLLTEVAVGSLLGAAALWGWLRPSPEPTVHRQYVNLDLAEERLGEISRIYGTAVAPDGSALVYAGTPGGIGSALWIKERGELEGRKLVDLARAPEPPGPSFSPDGQWVLYQNGRLWKVPRTGGPPTALTESSEDGSWGTWLDDGTVAFTTGNALKKTSASGGTPSVVLTAEEVGGSLHRVTAVPGTGAVLVSVGTEGQTRILAVDLDDGRFHEVIPSGAGAWVVGGDILLFGGTDGTLRAAAFDTRALAIQGSPATVLEGIASSYFGVGAFAAADGTLLYAPDAQGDRPDRTYRLVSVSRDGVSTPLDSAWTFGVQESAGVALSPDGRQAAVAVGDGDRIDIYVVDLPDGPERRLTFEGQLNYRPTWSPDGESVLYSSDAGGRQELWQRRADGSGTPSKVVSEGRRVVDGAWSPDGRWILYRTDIGDPGLGDILAVRTGGDTTRVPLLATPATEYLQALSPDGRWLAHLSNATGRPTLYVVPFPDVQGGRWEVPGLAPEATGLYPRWSRDGRTLFYVSFGDRLPGDALTAVEVSGGTPFRLGVPQPLFNLPPAFLDAGAASAYDVFPGGDRFLMLQTATGTEAGGRRELVLVENWLPEIRAVLGGRR